MTEKHELVRGYAEALFAVAEAEGEEAAVEAELYAFAKTLEAQIQLREAVTDPGLPAQNKKDLVRDVLGERANPITVNALGFLIDQGRTREIVKIGEELAQVAAERRAQVLAEVRSAVPLGEEQQRRLAIALSRATGRKVDVKVVIDPTVVGGIVARVGDEVLDGSVRTRLDEARQQLTRR